MALEEIKSELGGKWKLDRSENFDEFLKELGLNIVFRKLAGAATPTVEFTVEDGIIKMISKVSFFNQVLTFDLDKEHVQSFEGSEMNCKTRWEESKLITEATPMNEKQKPQTFQRQKLNDELVQTMLVGEVKCIRYFKPVN
ncbi:sodium/calcium exchanger regulatory protein 1-like [Mytilus californianus]|uniref:sodium/calcium exchanger regulatory protein 1-like n=1 Tax=Mytilus californianus TaxID=6549 RepID=UPI002247F9F1|nr:sodium/calcium exchanger regulatory protein 1-like [Mytilus californianus]